MGGYHEDRFEGSNLVRVSAQWYTLSVCCGYHLEEIGMT